MRGTTSVEREKPARLCVHTGAAQMLLQVPNPPRRRLTGRRYGGYGSVGRKRNVFGAVPKKGRVGGQYVLLDAPVALVAWQRSPFTVQIRTLSVPPFKAASSVKLYPEPPQASGPAVTRPGANG